MPKVPYTKPALTYADQLKQLKDRGLVIADDEKTIHLLEQISYYRLSGYWYPLLADKSNHTFKQNSSFETAFRLYCFDKELRKLVLSEIEKIEVAVRAKMIYILSHKHGAFWYADPSLFIKQDKHANTLAHIRKEFSRSDEEFIKSFKAKYSDPLPPSWMILEIASFGTLSMLFDNLKPGREKRAIANHFGLADSVFSTWLHSIVYLRNVCAHHTRLWNRSMSISPQFPLTPKLPWLANTAALNNKRTYFMLSLIRYLLHLVMETCFKVFMEKLPEKDTRPIHFYLDETATLMDRTFRREAIQNIENISVRNFWDKEFPHYNRYDLLPVLNKLGGMLAHPVIKRVLIENPEEVYLRKAMDEQKILLLNLAKGHLGEDVAHILGALFISSLNAAAFSRVDVEEGRRIPFMVYLDEFHNFTTLSLVGMFSELRKFAVGLILAHQYFHQLEDDIRRAILGNVGTMIAFRVGTEDAQFLSKEMYPVVDMEGFINLPNYHIYLKLMIDGVPSKPFSACTIESTGLIRA